MQAYEVSKKKSEQFQLLYFVQHIIIFFYSLITNIFGYGALITKFTHFVHKISTKRLLPIKFS